MNFLMFHTRDDKEVLINMDHVVKVSPYTEKFYGEMKDYDVLVKGLECSKDIHNHTILIFSNGGEFIIKEPFEEVVPFLHCIGCIVTSTT